MGNFKTVLELYGRNNEILAVALNDNEDLNAISGIYKVILGSLNIEPANALI